MLDKNTLIEIQKERFRNPEIYCDECDHTGRLFYIDDDKRVNHQYCPCYIKHRNSVVYPRLLKESRVPHMAWDFNFDDYKNTGATATQVERNNSSIAALKNACVNIDSFIGSGQNWYVEGHRGTGKTILACMIAKYAMSQGMPAAYTEFSVAADIMLREATKEERDWLDYIRWCSILVVDGVDGFTTGTGIHEGLFDRLVRPRVQNHRSTVYVSTLPLQMIHEKLGHSNAGLIVDRCEKMTFLGKDFRASS